MRFSSSFDVFCGGPTPRDHCQEYGGATRTAGSSAKAKKNVAHVQIVYIQYMMKWVILRWKKLQLWWMSLTQRWRRKRLNSCLTMSQRLASSQSRSEIKMTFCCCTVTKASIISELYLEVLQGPSCMHESFLSLFSKVQLETFLGFCFVTKQTYLTNPGSSG